LELMGEGFLPPGFLRLLLDELLGEMASMRECSLGFKDFTKKNLFCPMSELKSRATNFYVNQLKGSGLTLLDMFQRIF